MGFFFVLYITLPLSGIINKCIIPFAMETYLRLELFRQYPLTISACFVFSSERNTPLFSGNKSISNSLMHVHPVINPYESCISEQKNKPCGAWLQKDPILGYSEFPIALHISDSTLHILQCTSQAPLRQKT
jgi:hypothetical protein